MKDKILVGFFLLMAIVLLAIVFILFDPAGYHAFSQGVGVAFHEIGTGIVILFFVCLLFGIAWGLIKLNHARHSHVIRPGKHGPAQAVIHKGTIVQLATADVVTDPQQQIAHLKDIMQLAITTANMAKKMEPYITDVTEQKQIEAPTERIPDVVRYSDVADQIPDDMSLLGIHPEDGSLELIDWEKLKCLWLVGSSSTGKSNTIYGKALEAVEKGAKLLVVDQHAKKEDSLARKLAPLSHAFLWPVAVSDKEVLQILNLFKMEFDRRVDGADCAQRIVLICDEMNRMVRNEELKKPLQEIVAICGEESRGFKMYGWFLSQKCAHLKWLRDSAITVIVHRLTRFEEALLACNEDRQAAKRLLGFKIGRTYAYGVDIEDLIEIQQALYDDAPYVDADTVEVPTSYSTSDKQTSGNSNLVYFNTRLKQVEAEKDTQPLYAQKKEIDEGLESRIGRVTQLMSEGESVNKILSEEWGVPSGGAAYQKALAELREIQKIIARRAMVG